MTRFVPIKVLYVLGRMQQGGIEVRLVDLMRRLRRDEIRVDVCALSGESGPLDGDVVLEACAAGVPVLATDLGGVREIAARLPLVRYLPLTKSTAEWAAVAVQLPSEAARIQIRDASADIFRTSVFHADRFVEAHRQLWSRRAGRTQVVACS